LRLHCSSRSSVTPNITREELRADILEITTAVVDQAIKANNQRLIGMINEDLTAINRRIDNLSRRMNKGFKNISQKFLEIDQRFTSIDQRFASIDQRFIEIDRRFASIDQRFDQIDTDSGSKAGASTNLKPKSITSTTGLTTPTINSTSPTNYFTYIWLILRFRRQSRNARNPLL
jgi:DNA anti-recombination protein RmuC